MKYFEREGKIIKVDICLEDHGFLTFDISIKCNHGYVTVREASIPRSWIEETKPKAFPTYTQGFLKGILSVLKKAKVESMSELVGKEVICYFDCSELKRWEFVKNEKKK